MTLDKKLKKRVRERMKAEGLSYSEARRRTKFDEGLKAFEDRFVARDLMTYTTPPEAHEAPYVIDDVFQNIDRGADAWALFRVTRVRGRYLDLVDFEDERRVLIGVDFSRHAQHYRRTALVRDDFDRVKRVRAINQGSRLKHLTSGEIRLVTEVVNGARYYVQKFDKTGPQYRETFGSLQREYVAYGWGVR